MTTRRPALRAALLATALVLPLAACSGGDDEVKDFCQQGEEAFSEIDASGSLASDPKAFQSAVSDLHDGFESVDAPDAIADDWKVFSTMFGDLEDKLKDVDPDDTAAFNQALTEFGEQASSDEFTQASDNIGTYITENCDS